jgi:hypothetical protein
MERFNSYLRCGLLLASTLAVTFIGLGVYRLTGVAEQVLINANRTVTTADLTMKRLDTVAQVYEDQLTSDRSRKALQASLEAAAAWKATAQLVNVTVIPNINRTLLSLSQTTNSLNKFVEDQNGNTTTLIRNLSGVARGTETAIGGIQKDTSELILRGGRTAEAVERLADTVGATATETTSVLSELRGTMSEMRAAAAQLRVASEQAPLVAEDVQRIVHSASRWQSALRIIGIILSAGAILR